MYFKDIYYNPVTCCTWGVPEGETVPVLLDYDNDQGNFVLHPSVAWARAEQALLQEQRAAKIAREKEDRLAALIDTVLATHIPYRICAQLPGWPGTAVVRTDIVYLLRKEGYLE